MALYKLCSRCSEKIPYGNSMCPECEKKHKKERWKEYDTRVRKAEENIKYDSFYHDSSWIKVRELVLQRDNYMCVECYRDSRINIDGIIVHHKIPIKSGIDGWNKRLSVDNLVCLCGSCHAEAHSKLDKNK